MFRGRREGKKNENRNSTERERERERGKKEERTLQSRVKPARQFSKRTGFNPGRSLNRPIDALILGRRSNGASQEASTCRDRRPGRCFRADCDNTTSDGEKNYRGPHVTAAFAAMKNALPAQFHRVRAVIT